jgi:NAD-dependent dihydropyrimidine dehydrogenase PreA subunit
MSAMSKKTRTYLIGVLTVGLLAFVQHINAASPDVCKNCVYASSEQGSALLSGTSGITRMVLTLLSITVLTVVTWVTYRKKSYVAIGSAVFLLVGGSFVYYLTDNDMQHNHPEGPDANCKIEAPANDVTDEFRPVGAEFENTAATDSTQAQASTNDDLSDFKPVSDEFSNAPSKTETSTTIDDTRQQLLYQTLVLLLLTAVIGLTIKYRLVRRMRGIIMLASVVYLGFVSGGCPCMIMSFQDTVLFVLGGSASMVAMLWFIGLIPVTYFFGKAWCGWLCHLGGLQDFLFRVSGKKVLTSINAQKTVKWVQVSVFVVLIVQLVITRTNIWVRYDPFKAAFNLIAGNNITYALLAILLVSCVFIYRPFCRMACPVGLVLGWVTKIPGARKLQLAPSCTSCGACAKACHQSALAINNKNVTIRWDDCILCGECMDSCKKDSLIIKNKTR